MQAERLELEINGKTLFIESGMLAKQAAGSVVVGFEETIILAASGADDKPKGGDFLPLTVDYRDRTSAAGRIPGGFLKREARPSDGETLTSRLIDRSIRPMFDEGYSNETQVIIHPLSFDYEHETAPLALIGASACLAISHIPFHTPLAGVRIGRVDGEFICNPTFEQMENSDINILCAGTEDSIGMVEGGGNEISEDDVIEALEFAHEWIKKICALQVELIKRLGKEKMEVITVDLSTEIAAISAKVGDNVREAVLTEGKKERGAALKAVRNSILFELLGEEPDEDVLEAHKEAYGTVQKNFIREMILSEGIRADGRKTDEIRNIEIGVDALPRTHGSAVFTRGETQALVCTTLGTGQDELMVDSLAGRKPTQFMLHYNFPPFCVGEVKRIMGPGRREIGHGTLAERSLEPVIPAHEDFPYTIRIVSEILESNGSSSMASVCGGSLSLMDAGVPISNAVAGIAMGLVQDGDRVAILSDILGLEDALGDMDFKVAGTKNGITAVQMDIKIKGLPVQLMKDALSQAKEGRLHILGEMAKALEAPREEINKHAPRIHTLQINPDKIRDIIGPGGKVIRGIVAETGVQMDVNDEGIVKIASTSGEQLQAALHIINQITQEAVIGKIYVGTIKKIVDFGAFVEIFPGTEGLCHISEMANHRVESMDDEVSVEEEMLVKVIDIDPSSGKIRLSRKEAMRKGGDEDGGSEERSSGRPPARSGDGGRRDSRGGGRGDSRGGRGGGDRNHRR